MSKTKMFNVKQPFTLTRPDGSSQTFQAGLQEISTEHYHGKVAGPDGKQVDHHDNAKSDATHWYVLQNAEPVETAAEKAAAAAEAKKAEADAKKPPVKPVGGETPGTVNPSTKDGGPAPGEVANA